MAASFKLAVSTFEPMANNYDTIMVSNSNRAKRIAFALQLVAIE